MAHTLQVPPPGNASALWTVKVWGGPGLLDEDAVSRITCNSWDLIGPNIADSAGERKPLTPIIPFPHYRPIVRPLKGTPPLELGPGWRLRNEVCTVFLRGTN